MAPLLPLEDFRKILSYHPYHFWQLADGVIAPVTSACNTIVRQYGWQDANQPGRQEVMDAIEYAESRLSDFLGYPIAPQWITETIPWKRFFNRTMVRRMDWDPTGRWISLRLKKGKIIEVGLETNTLLGTPAVVYSDTDGDGLNDTFVTTQATIETNPDRINIYFAAADRLDSEGTTERWRVKPVSITISGGLATIRGRSWMLARPVLYQGAGLTAIDPTVAGNFVTTLDVTNHFTDPNQTGIDTAQATIIWETVPCHGWWCACSSCGGTFSAGMAQTDPASVAKAIARVGIRDADSGIVTPAEAVMDTTSGTWSNIPWDVWREPDTVTVRYQAGLPYDSGDVNKKFQTVVARFAAAELAGRLCACDTANRELGRWQTDLARTKGEANEEFGAISRSQLDNPFGTRRGHLYAWSEVKRLSNLVGITAYQ